MEEEFSIEEVKNCLTKFLEYAGYREKSEADIGFVKPDIYAERRDRNKKYEIVGVVREGLEAGEEGVLSGLKDLCAVKCFLGAEADYVLALPPTSERLMIAFLIEEKDWYFPIKDQELMIWLVNPKKETVNSIIGWPIDETFRDFFENPDTITFDALIGRQAAQKMVEEEEKEEKF